MWIMFIIGIVIAAISGLLFDTSVVNWRVLETIIILTGATGLVSAIGEARRMVASNEIVHLRSRTGSNLLVLKSIAPSYLSIVDLRIRSKSSNLEQYEAVRPWFEAVSRIALERDDDPAPVGFENPVYPENITDPEILALHSEISDAISRYEEALAEYNNTKKQLSRGALEEVVLWFSPFLLSVAIALSLFKALYQ